MSTTSERKHPREDLLADLAADVLPVDLAARVESHVAGCPRCAAVLAEAEEVRALLRADVPPRMPDEVAARIDAALAGLAFADVLPADRARSLPAFEPAEADPELEARRPRDEDDVAVEARWAAAARASAEEDARASAQARLSRSRQVGVERIGGQDDRVVPLSRLRRLPGTQRSRRQALEEHRSDERAGRVTRVGGRLLAVAAALVVLAAAGVGLRSAGLFGGSPQVTTASESTADSGDSGDFRDPAASGGAAPVLAPVLQTGADYTAAGLAGQTRALVAASEGERSKALAEDQGATRAEAPQAPAPLVTRATGGNQALRTPAALQACMRQLGLGDKQPVAVDLARYEGRDAAVIVFRLASGGYETWVVARDCRAGADGTLSYTTVPG